MLHEPATQQEKDYASSYKMKLGVKMFLVYSLIYVSFVIINIVNPLLMEKIVFMGLNLAVVYGFSLIIGAFILAIIYNFMCTREEDTHKQLEENGGAK